VFPYSTRPGTPAARMTQVPGDDAKRHEKILRNAGQSNLGRHLDSMVGTSQMVLVEKSSFGRTETFAPVQLDGGHTPGELVRIAIVGVQGGELTTIHSNTQAAE